MLWLEHFAEQLYSGDPEVRTWFMVKNDYLPLMLCLSYVTFIKILGPALMRHRKPFSLRYAMVIHNSFLVLAYTVCIVSVMYFMLQIDTKILCYGTLLVKGTKPYYAVCFGYIIYLLKYVEFLDTVFFILRKKDHLVTNLHVIHHFSLPLYSWLLLRTEKSAYSSFVAIVNSVVHIIMYTYYGLAAMGPSVQKYLWWKKYLTIIQMTQFVIFFLFVIGMSFTDCKIVGMIFTMTVMIAVGFFSLFYNFYQNTFNANSGKRNKSMAKE